jgi:hypothetical protein
MVGALLGRFGALTLAFSVIAIALSGSAVVDGYTVFLLCLTGFLAFLFATLFIVTPVLRKERHRLVSQNAMFFCAMFFGFMPGPIVLALAIPASEVWRIMIAASPFAYMAYRLAGYVPPTVYLKAGQPQGFGLTLSLRTLAQKSARERRSIVIAHLSDLHLPGERTLEGDIDQETVVSTVRRTLQWALRRARFVAITGDVTDQARPVEWNLFLQVLEQLHCPLDSGRFFVIPGNHDLSLSSDVLPGLNNTVYFDQRCLLFIDRILVNCPITWKMLIGEERVSVRQFLADRSGYLAKYKDHAPYARVPGYWTQLGIVIPERLLNATDAYAETAWPTRRQPTCADFMKLAYPMIMHEDNELLIVGLNSANVESKNISGSAVGWLGEGQLERLRMVLSGADNRHVILLIHHHIGFPPEKLQEFRAKYGGVQTDALTLLDADKLGEIIASTEKCYVLHGHKHFPYTASFQNVVVISGHSVVYGPHEHKSGGATYQITADGRVLVCEEFRVALAKPAANERKTETKKMTFEEFRETLPAGTIIFPFEAFRDAFYNRIVPTIAVIAATVALLAWQDERWDRLLSGFWAYWAGGTLHPLMTPVLHSGLFVFAMLISTKTGRPQLNDLEEVLPFWFNAMLIIGIWGAIFVDLMGKIPEKMEAPPAFGALLGLDIVMGITTIALSPPRILFRRLVAVCIALLMILLWKHAPRF